MRWVKAHWIDLAAPILVSLLSLVVCLPLFHPGFFTMHDYQQVARLFELDKSLLSGQFPVRWVEDLGFGFGYPLFNFYPPLVYYLGEVFHLAHLGSFVAATKIVWGIALVGSALSMYLLAKELFGKVAGIVASLFYLYAPYHALDAYVRGALAELFSFVWLPLILLFSARIVTDKINSWRFSLLTGLVLALLMITHPLVFLPFGGLFMVWYLGLILFHRENHFGTIIKGIAALLLALSLSAFFWLPSLAEKQYTLTDQFLTTNLASYKIHFVCLPQLWNSPWGFGGSVAGCTDGLSFMIGKLYLLIIFLSPFTIWLLYRSKKFWLSKIMALSFVLSLLSLFMTLDYSQFFWDHLQPLWYLQFPWRFLEFAALFNALLAGGALVILPRNTFRLTVATVLIAALLIIEARYFRPQFFLTSKEADQLISGQEIKWHVSASSFEYMPKGLRVYQTKDGGYLPVGLTPAKVGEPGFIKESPDLETFSFSFLPAKITLAASSKTGNTLIFPITNFPGWHATLDGQPWAIADSNPWKLITISFPSGNHQLFLDFGNTWARSLGNMMSFVTILLLPVFLYATRRS